MSSQLNFYILPEDLKNIELFFNQEKILFISNPIYKENEVLTESIYDSHHTPSSSRYYLVHQDDLEKIKLKWIEAQNHFLVDIFESLAVEFDTGYFMLGSQSQHKKLHRARLYFKTDFYREKTLIYKDLRFTKWAISLLNKYKRKFLIKYKSQQYIQEHKQANLSSVADIEWTDLTSLSVIKWLEQSNGKLVL